MSFAGDALTKTQRRILGVLGPVTHRWGAYLGGGTAVAMHLRHRRSDDFDWFTPKAVPSARIASAIKAKALDLEVTSDREGTFLGFVDGVKWSVFRYRYALLAPATITEEGAALAQIPDLAAMKFLAISQRATKKDYIDIRAIASSLGGIAPMVAAFEKKYPEGSVSHVLRALTYFDDADLEPMPLMQQPLTWARVKKDVTALVDAYRHRR